MKTIIFGIIATALLTWYMSYGADWSGGAGKTSRAFVTDYVHMAYDQGLGAAAAKEYFDVKMVDHNPNAADRQDGEPIKHEIKNIIADAMTVAVYHHIDATRGEPEQDVVDIYRTFRNHIVERTRVSQVSITATPNAAPK
jgi:predicted SnoaL-like aldol condensation-catalyzing enzyme